LGVLREHMRDNTARLQTSSSLAADPRWELVERIISSNAFIKSPRLCSFLVYVCDLSLHGRGDEINEVNIGKALFDRAPDYDSSVDGIVRSHASRLRQRLEQYFNEEGAHETVRLLIPKGGYMPFFEERTPALAPVPLSFPSAPDLRPAKQTTAGDQRLRLIQFLGAALALACVAILCLAVRLRERAGPQMVTIRNPLWARLFPPDRSTMIVASDTGLTSLRTLTGKNVDLAEYLSGDYRNHISRPLATTPDVASELGARRYTSIVDLNIVTRFYQLPGMPANRIQVRYARDLQTNDLKDGPVILLGSQEGTPWIELFEGRMNFVLVKDQQKDSFVVFNRSPRAGESARYEVNHLDPQHKIYGLIALEPNLEGSGQILILEGTSMAGTESAADFVFDDARLLPFLEKIKTRGGTIPYFELLLQANSMNGSASQSEILAYRTLTN
jgi:hypothetical protein